MVGGVGTGGDAAIALERLCEQLAEARWLAQEGGELPALDAVLARLRADGADLEQLTDEADDLLRRCGAPRGLGSLRDFAGRPRRTGPGLPYLGGGHPVEEGYACPAGRCTRVLLASETSGRPVCEIFDRPLPLKRL